MGSRKSHLTEAVLTFTHDLYLVKVRHIINYHNFSFNMQNFEVFHASKNCCPDCEGKQTDLHMSCSHTELTYFLVIWVV